MTTHWLWIAVPVCIAILLLLGFMYERISAARDAIRCPPIGELIDINGRKLHLIRKGTGSPTVVIVSGAGASSFVWWDHQDKLAELTTVVTYDRTGLGWSDPGPLPRTLEERAAELHALLVQADIPPPYVLVGFSFGGLLIRLFTRDHRNKVAGMVFVDSGHEAVYRPPEIAAKRLSGLLRNLGFIASVGALRLVGFRSGTQLLTRPVPLNAMQRHVSENSVATAHSYFVGSDEMASAVHSHIAMKGADTKGVFGAIPIAVITHGIPFSRMSGVSENLWFGAQEHLASLSTDSTLVVAQNSGHIVPLEEPELVRETIRKVVVAVRHKAKLAT